MERKKRERERDRNARLHQPSQALAETEMPKAEGEYHSRLGSRRCGKEAARARSFATHGLTSFVYAQMHTV